MTRPFKHQALRLGVAAIAMAGVAAPAFAQYAPTPQYQRDMDRYRAQQSDYREARADYAQARRDYERRMDDYQRARDRYDRRYGSGAYARRYGPPPEWNEARYADRYGADAGYTTDSCRGDTSTRTVTGGVIGALAGAALGSNVAAGNARTEGAVLGALVGGAVGAGIGKSTAKCDERGYYYSYDQTVPYHEGDAYRGRKSGRYDYRYYTRQSCRLAPAPVDRYGQTEERYVRVCPDGDGRYRLTG